ncbi:MAG: hypothetical protein QXU51_07495, partial [Desulfurococcus sp.]
LEERVVRRRYRDDLKMMILDLLEESPYHTYALMKKLKEVRIYKGKIETALKIPVSSFDNFNI